MKVTGRTLLIVLGIFIIVLLVIQYIGSFREGLSTPKPTHKPTQKPTPKPTPQTKKRQSSPMTCKSGTEKIGSMCYENCAADSSVSTDRLSCVKK